jgi:hypothetical protein
VWLFSSGFWSGLYIGALDVITDSDMQELISYLLSAFGIGLAMGYLLRVFRRAADFIR